MSLTDPISNLLTSIRNALQAKKETVDVPASKLSERILNILKDECYIEDYRLLKNNTQGTLKVYLKYEGNKKPAIIGLERISKPGLRVYKGNTEIPKVLNGLGTAIVSTSKGIVKGDDARKLEVGGEVLCYVW